MSTPEERARQNIDKLLTAAGWCVQSRDALDLGAALGVAVREFPLKAGFADYLLFASRKAIGAIEAKSEGTPLSGMVWPGTVKESVLKFKDDLERSFPQRVHWSDKLHRDPGYGWIILFDCGDNCADDAVEIASAMQTLIDLTHTRLSAIIKTLPFPEETK